mmetsp:Transcript_132492/g.255225  ORF Transcript_132492/g.255225 Transcript_132492/m.255225 type:complete len:204 (-) Transcript_132492:13-624(-)
MARAACVLRHQFHAARDLAHQKLHIFQFCKELIHCLAFLLVNVSSLLLVTVLLCVNHALACQGLLYKLGKAIIISWQITLVALSISACRNCEVLHGGISFNPMIQADGLPVICGTVNISNEHSVTISICLSQLVPISLHLSAVTSPWCQELHKSVLAAVEDFRLEVCSCEFTSPIRDAQAGSENAGQYSHHHAAQASGDIEHT